MAQTNTVQIQLTAEDKASSVFKSHAATLAFVQQGYVSLTDYMKQEAAQATATAKANTDAAEATEKVGASATSAGSSFSTLFKSFTLGSLAASAIQQGLQLARQAMTDAVQDASNLQTSIIGLNSAAQSFGVSSDQMNAAVKTLTADGLLNFMDVSTSLRNLLSTGMSIDQATTLMQRFKDEAASGGSESIKFADKVTNLSEAWMTGSSQMGNLNGHVANFSDALEIGAAALGKNVSQLSAAETEQAKLIGYMQQGAYTAGNAAQFAETYAGSIAKMDTESQKASSTLGQAMLPALQYLSDGVTGFTGTLNDSAGGMQEFQSYLVVLAAMIRTVANVFIGSVQIMYGGLQGLRSALSGDWNGAWSNFMSGVDGAAGGFIDTWNDAYGQFEKIYTDAMPAAAQTGANKRVEVESAAQRKISQQLEEANRDYARQVEQRTKQFNESLRDMVIAHRDKSRSIQADIDKETAAYDKANQRRQAAYAQDLADMEDNHLEKVADIEDQIAEAKAEGYSVDGVLYADANQKKIDDLQKQLDKENAEYQKQRDRKKAQYDQDVADAQESHNEKLTQLQQSLAEENAVLEKHRADVAAIGEAQKEDDISRLQRQYAEQAAEAARNHAEQLAKIRQQGSESGSAYASSFGAGLSGLPGSVGSKAREAAAVANQQFAEGGRNAGTSMWENFKTSLVNGFVNFHLVLYETLRKQFSSDTGKKFAALFSAIPIVGPALASISNALGNLPKLADGGPVRAGQAYWVGDNPDGSLNATSELFVPGQSGQILNQSQLGGGIGGGQGITININQPTYYTPEDAARLAKDIGFRLSLL